MSFPMRRSSGPGTGTVRVHRSLSTLLERLEPGDIAVIDERDLDAPSARRLAERRPFAVVNAAEFISGRFANLGPQVLVDAGIVLLEADREAISALRDGRTVRIDGGTVYDGDRVVLDGHRVTADEVRERSDAARGGLADQLASFAHTSTEFLRREEGLLLHGTGAPALRTRLEGRPVVVVGPEATRADLKPLRRFLREQKPVLIGVDAGARLLGRRADVVVVSDGTLTDEKVLARADEVVVHGTHDGVLHRLQKHNVVAHTVDSSATGTDVALLLAHLGGARLVVPVGSPATLDELVDRDRSDQASTFLTRLRLGSRVVDASSVPLLYTGRVRTWQVLAVLLLALVVLAVALAVTPDGNDLARDLLDLGERR